MQILDSKNKGLTAEVHFLISKAKSIELVHADEMQDVERKKKSSEALLYAQTLLLPHSKRGKDEIAKMMVENHGPAALASAFGELQV